MTTWLAGIALRAAPYLLAAAAVLGVWLYVDHLRESLADTQARLTSTQVELETTTIRATAAQRQHEAAIVAMAAERAAADARAATLATARDDVSRAPPADDGPVAPVLRGALDALRRRLAQ